MIDKIFYFVHVSLNLLLFLLAINYAGYAAAANYINFGHLQLAMGSCKQLMGPYNSQASANSAAWQMRNQGFQTSNIWGQGGLYSYSARQYYFNVFYPC